MITKRLFIIMAAVMAITSCSGKKIDVKFLGQLQGENSDTLNRHRIIKFRLPALSDGSFVVLKSEDALENYLIEDVSDFRFNPIGQGLFIRENLLYMPTGLGKAEAPSILYIWDLKRHSMHSVDLSLCTTGEFEDISFYKGAFYIQGQDGVFRLRLAV